MNISDAQIGRKFEVSAMTIGNVCRGFKSQIPEEDQQLIRALKAEQQRLRAIHRERMLPALAYRHNVRQAEIKRELQKLGVNIQ